MSRVQYKITHYSYGIRPCLVDMTEPVIEKAKQVLGHINQLDLQDNTYISVHDLNKDVHAYIGHFAHQWLGNSADSDCASRAFDIDLLIDGKVYDYPYIVKHFMEVKALIEDIHTEKVLNEI